MQEMSRSLHAIWSGGALPGLLRSSSRTAERNEPVGKARFASEIRGTGVIRQLKLLACDGPEMSRADTMVFVEALAMLCLKRYLREKWQRQNQDRALRN